MKILAMALLFILGLFLFYRAQRLIKGDSNQLTVFGMNKNKIENFTISRKKESNVPVGSNTKEPPLYRHSAQANTAVLTNALSEIPLSLSDKLSEFISQYNKAENISIKYEYLLSLIDICYKNRKQKDYVIFGTSLIHEFSALVEIMVKDNVDDKIKGCGHMKLSTLLVNNKQFDSALDICSSALVLGLDDGTVTGFSGRIKRITKLKDKHV